MPKSFILNRPERAAARLARHAVSFVARSKSSTNKPTRKIIPSANRKYRHGSGRERVKPCSHRKALIVSFHLLGRFDCAIQSAFSVAMGVVFPPDAWEQMSLPILRGGFGLRRATLHASAAYLASVCNAGKLDKWAALQAIGYADAVIDLQSHVGEPVNICPENPPFQRSLSALVDQKCLQELLIRYQPLDQARIHAIGAPGASSWIGVIPSPSLNESFSSLQYTTLLKWWLGMSVYTTHAACPACGVLSDRLGYHALTCTSGGGLGVRHNALREVFLHFCKLAHLPALREAPALLADSACRPADVLILPCLPSSIDRPTCLDFAVTHTQQPNHINRASVCVAAAEQYERKVKFPMYKERCDEAKLNFIPMVVDCFGAWGPSSNDAFKILAKAAANRKNVPEDYAHLSVRRSMSVVLQRYNVRTLLALAPPELDLDDGTPNFV